MLIGQKLNTGNHEEGSSHPNSTIDVSWQGSRRSVEGSPSLKQTGIWKSSTKARMGRITRRNVTVFLLQTGKLGRGEEASVVLVSENSGAFVSKHSETTAAAFRMTPVTWGREWLHIGPHGWTIQEAKVLGWQEQSHCPVKKQQGPRQRD